MNSNCSSNKSDRAHKKSPAGALVVALLVAAAGPLCYRAFAQSLTTPVLRPDQMATDIRAVPMPVSRPPDQIAMDVEPIQISPACADGTTEVPLQKEDGALTNEPLPPCWTPAAGPTQEALHTAQHLMKQIEGADPNKPKVIEDALGHVYTGAFPRPDGSNVVNATGVSRKVSASLGKNLVGRYQGRQEVWKKIVELHNTQGIKFAVVSDKPGDFYHLSVNDGRRISKGRANDLTQDGFRERQISEATPHGALALFVGEQEPVELYIDDIAGLKIAKVVKHGAAYPGKPAGYDALLQARAAESARLGPPTAELIEDSTPNYEIGFVRRQLMKAAAAIWKVTDDALGSQWDKLPIHFRTKYLYANMQSLRLNFWDANAVAKRDETKPPTAYELLYRSGNGANLDPTRPELGEAYVSHFSRVGKPEGPPTPLDEEALKKAAELAALETRKRNPETGKPEMVEAGILNVHSGSWIQKMVHDWMNHSRKSIKDNPFVVPLPADHPLRAEGLTHMTLERTQEGKTKDGIPVFRNELSPGWDLSMIYGTTDELQATLRTFEGGKLKVGKNQRLQEDPQNPGLPLTGFNDNMSAQLAFLHTLFTLEHNAVAEALKAEHPDWSDERIFQIARLRLSALAAKLHTLEWTRALLPQDGLQVGMWLDWYGFIGKRNKGWVMRVSDRHPWIGTLLSPLRTETLFGAPGTKTEQFGIDHAMPEEFVNVYRLHTMIRDYYKMQKLTVNGNGEVEMEVTAELPFSAMHGFKTQALSEAIPLEEQAISWAAQSAGALTLHNMPDELRRLRTQDGKAKDMGIVHNVRIPERVDASTYVKFTMKLGETPPKNFLELTGGNKEVAAELETVFGTIDKVTFRAGILAERKPEGFALGNRQFKVFVLMAPRRLKSDRFLSQMYSAKYYGGQSGINYVENTTFSDMNMRHFPKTRPAFEGVDNAFKPLPPPGSLPQRTIDAAAKTSEALSGALGFNKRTESLSRMQGILAELKAGTGRKEDLIRRVYEAEELGQLAATKQFKQDLRNTRIALLGRLKQDQSTVDPATLPGETAIQKKYWGLLLDENSNPRLDEKGQPKLTAKFGDSYDFLRRSGASPWTSVMTAALSHVGFAGKTQKNMTKEEKELHKPGRFDIYVPNLIDAQAHSNARVYASRETARAKGLKPGDIDISEFDRMFREAGMREVLTAEDMKVAIESNRFRDKQEGRGNPLTRWLGSMAAKRRVDQLFDLFADRVVWQEAKFGKLVPGISRQRLLEVYNGTAQAELLKERAGIKKVDPSAKR